MSKDFPVTQFSVRRDVLSFEDICDVVLDSLECVWSLLALSPCESVCLLNVSKEERADLVG